MRSFLTLRLRTMMFLQFFLNGTTLPIFSLYLRDFLHFSGTQAGLVIAMSAVSSFVAPLLGSLVADRLIRVERLYGLCHLFGGMLMFLLSREHTFPAVLVVYLLYMLIYGPTNALVNVITLHHSPDARRRFSGIRLWGTVGWVAVAWLFGFFWLRGGGGAHVSERLPNALILSSIVSMVLAAYSLLLPRSPVASPTARPRSPAERPPLFPRESLRVLMRPQLLLFLLVSFLVYGVDTYFYFGSSLFLTFLRVPSDSIMPLMSIGQMVEVVGMALLGIALSRFSFKAVLLGGIAMELVRFLLLLTGSPFGLVVAALAVHGLCFALFFGTAPIFLDSHSSPETRAGIQQFFMIATTGLGALIGNFSAGSVFDRVTASGVTAGAFRSYWLVPELIALCTLIVMLLFFKERPAQSGSEA